MTIKEAMEARHTVRKYEIRPIPEDILEKLRGRIEADNKAHGLHMQLVTENTKALGPVWSRVLAKGVRNYVVLAGADVPGVDEWLGYCGAGLMLQAQMLGLNTWWIGGTYSRKAVAGEARLKETERLSGILVIGYGSTQGVPHKSKTPQEISSYTGPAPRWFMDGVQAVLLAPTALNKQAFTITGHEDTVSMSCENGAFSGVDLGIGKYYFEMGAGKEHFRWAEVALK